MRLSLPFVFLFMGVASAQDMPLSQILPDGTTWKPSSNPPTIPKSRFIALPSQRAVSINGRLHEVPLIEPSAVVEWNGGGTLVVADAGGAHLWAFRIDQDGSLTDGDRYYALRVRPGRSRSEATGLTIDPVGRVYAATSEGVQVFDPTGRLCGVLNKPERKSMGNVVLDGTTLYVECGGKWYERPLKPSGLTPTKKP